jgi:response regulator RpfG family c-di-GMP phosphodiesterase
MDNVLIVDDEAPVRRLMHRWLDAEGVSAVEAASAEQGLLLASQLPPAVALCDINLPRGQNGYWLVEQLRLLHPDTAVVMTTGLQEFDAVVTGLRFGVTDYLVKPLTRERLAEALQRARLEHRNRTASTVGHTDESSMSVALLAVLRAQGDAAVHHAQRVSRLAVKLAAALNVDEAARLDIERAALLRDVARLDVHAIARHVPQLAAASAIVVAVQERFDGTGFPLRLKGDAIPLGARIVGLADVYDDLVAGHTPVAPARAVEMLCGARVREFDPDVLQALKALDLEA